ncbi:hypothetical protein F5Y13DRAFT_201363 [Hypoxylon sp. FL1857]|nr:hypothetical protein F5Y13DRAFT_201363 [Hypoxylon sp. FL1857]
MAWEQEGRHRSFSLNDRPPSDPRLLEQRRRLSALRHNNRLGHAVNFLLDQEIEAERLLVLQSSAIDVPPLSTLKFYDKVRLLAKLRLLKPGFEAAPAFRPLLNTAREPNLEGKVKLSLLQVTKWEMFHLEIFLAPISPEYCLDCFYCLLEEVAEPYASVGISNRVIPDDHLHDNNTKLSATESAQEQEYQDMQPRNHLSTEKLANWSYRLLEFPTSSDANGRTKFYTNWLPIDTKAQYERMSSLIKEHSLSAVFIRTRNIEEAECLASKLYARDHPSYQCSPRQDKQSEHVSHKLDESIVQPGSPSSPRDGKEEHQETGTMAMDIVSKSVSRHE